MGSYKISLKKSVEKDLRRIDRKEVSKILSEVENLQDDPFPPGSRKLVGSDNTYRIRIGDYRAVYMVANEVREIVVQRIAHRKDVYE